MQKKLKKSTNAAAAVSARREAATASRPVVGIFEPLEQRKMLSVSVDSAGWTQIGKSGDSRVIYVSSSQGSDSNSGTSQDSPVRSLNKAKSLLRSGMPDHMLLKRGDTWNESLGTWNKSGRSASEPMLIGAYGSDDARPQLKTGTSNGFDLNGKRADHLAIVGIHLNSHTRDPYSSSFSSTSSNYGIRFIGSGKGLLVEDVVVENYGNNISLGGWNGNPSDVTIRRSVVADSYTTSGSAAGVYATDVDGLTIEQNVFDHNGWNEKVGASRNVPSHNIYIQSDNTGVAVRGNVIANAGSHGLQMRAGGSVKDNLFVRNPIAMSFGLVNGAAAKAGGVTGEVRDNVVLDTRDIQSSGRGWGMGLELGNIRAATVANNIFANDSGKKAAAITLGYGTSVSNQSQATGVNNLTIEDNTVYNWYRGVSTASGLTPGASGYKGLNDLTVEDNDFQNVTSSKIVSHGGSYSSAEEDWDNNRYYDDASSSGWFNIGSSTTSLGSWKSRVESSAAGTRVGYADAGRDAGEYNASLGGSDSDAAFVSKAKQQSKAGGWRNAYTAAAANDYIRAGYNKTGGSSTVDDGGTSGGGGATPNEVEETPVSSPSKGYPVVESASLSRTKFVVRFSEDVSASLRAWDFQVTKADSSPIRTANFALAYDRATNTATLTWPGHNGGQLTGGDYTVRIFDQSVNDSSGNLLNNHQGDFFKSYTV